MARITVEDCIKNVKNRFELVLLASKRARDIEKGAQITVPRDNDKATIVALREIAQDTISLTGLEKLTKQGLAKSENERSWQAEEQRMMPETTLGNEDFSSLEDDEETEDEGTSASDSEEELAENEESEEDTK